jgi:DNA-binding cell septation regulator SpoVG
MRRGNFNHTTSQAELRRAEAATWGQPPKAEIRILRFAPIKAPASGAIAFLDAELGSGLIVRDLKVMRASNGGLWIATPSIKQVDRDGHPAIGANGKAIYKEIISFRERAVRDKFIAAVLDAVRRQYPNALEDVP